MSDPSRTESATPKRREEARQKGNIPRSKELASAVILLGGFSVLYFTSGHIVRSMEDMIRLFFTMKPSQLDTLQGLTTVLSGVVVRSALVLAPVFGVVVLCAAGANLAQVGFVFTTEPLTPSFDKLNPVAGLQRMFSSQSLVELVKSFVKIALVGWIAFRIIRREMPVLPSIIEQSPQEIVAYLAQISSTLLIHCGTSLLVLAAADYAFQRWSFEKSIRMTKQEVKEEMKDMEGDPAVKGRIRSLQREAARRRIMQEVPKADVIITNPTHYAVALRYERGSLGAPKVTAKGADLLARRMREIAAEHGVPVVERPPLARALYANVDEGQEIPEEFYRAVAEVLAYVYRLKAGRTA